MPHSPPFKLKLPTIGYDPIFMFVGERIGPTDRDHGYSRRMSGKIYVKTGFQFVEDEGWGYYQHPVTKEIRKRFQFF